MTTLEVTPPSLPACESFSSLTTHENCPRRYAFKAVERAPGEVSPGQFAFGNAVHRAFEVFVRERIRASAQDGGALDAAGKASAPRTRPSDPAPSPPGGPAARPPRRAPSPPQSSRLNGGYGPVIRSV